MTIHQQQLNKTISEAEAELIKACKAGDRQAQSRLYHRYAQSMLNVAYRIVWNREDARDVLQDAFVKIFRGMAELKEISTFPSWVKRIVVNTAINHHKKNGKWSFQELTDQDIKEPTESIDETTIQLNVKKVKQCLLKLPEGYRTVLSLYLIEGYDHKEIASILNITVSTSVSQYSRGKKRLRELLVECEGNR